MRVTSTLLAASLMSLPVAVHAEDPVKADPFRPVPPAWPDGWSGAEPPSPAPSKPAPSADDNEVFTFDEEAPSEPVTTQEAVNTERVEAPVVETQPPVASTEPTKSSAAPVDLRTPHLWMASGGALIGLSVLTALAIGVGFDEPGLAGATLGLGGALGIAGLTVGVVMQNQRLEAAGHDVAPALPSGVGLKVVLTR